MTKRKERLTVTVDGALIQIASEAVAAGRADSVSGWVNLALAERASKERRLLAMGEAIAAYEARFGELTPEELHRQERADRQAAIVVRSRSSGAATAGRTKRRAKDTARR